MPMINGRFYSPFGRYSPYVSMQIQRYHMAEVRQQAESNASALGGALANASQNLAQGMTSLAAQAAAKRIKAAASAAHQSSGVNLVT
ncbi:MAG TPA: hypothetical protein VNM46_10520 [Xanthobacteraceae bacterium]|jgi:hypothetical protein|nr:hypothetical protein [Xanthobacteraceae bacterium]